MNISHHAWKCNQGGIFGAKGISTDSLQHKANTHNNPLYLTPDYFLPASCSESYYSKNYVGNFNLNLKSKFRKISRAASVMLLTLSFLATTLEVKAQPNLGAPIPTSSQQQYNSVMSETLSDRRSVMRYYSESEEEMLQKRKTREAEKTQAALELLDQAIKGRASILQM